MRAANLTAIMQGNYIIRRRSQFETMIDIVRHQLTPRHLWMSHLILIYEFDQVSIFIACADREWKPPDLLALLVYLNHYG
jgi:hypothetical protein